jgi:hypothetical protein
MKTAGFDIVLLLNEEFLNQVSGAMFYNNFLTFNGKKDFRTSLAPDKLDRIPVSLRNFLEIRYRFKLLYEPFIDFKDDNKVEISAKLRVYLWILDGLEIKFDASLTMETPIAIDNSTKQLKITLGNTDIREFNINYNYSASTNVSLQLDDIFENALHAYFNDANTSFSIDLPSIKVQLPYAEEIDENKIPVDIRAIRTVNSSALAIAANLFGYTGGNANNLTEFARNCNVGLGISEMAMNKVYDFFWARTNWDKSFHKAGSFKINMVDKVLDIVTEILNFLGHYAVKFATLGFIDVNMDFVSSDFEYIVDVDFKTKPTFDIQNGNRVRIFNLGADLFIRLKMFATFDYTVALDTSGAIPDKCTPWDDDIILERKRKTVLIFDLGVPIRNLKIKSCTGEITINEEKKCLQCVVKELDVNIYDYVAAGCEFLLLPDSIKNRIVDGIKQKVVESIPPIVLSPTVFELDVKMIDWLVNVEGRKLEINDGEALVGAYVYFKELQNEIWPVPKYIVNINNSEIHRAGCDSILDTYETHQRGYYLLHNALKKNYDGCKKCLPAFHKR